VLKDWDAFAGEAKEILGLSPARRNPKFTVPEVWRTIVKKNDLQGSDRYDVLVCQHAVPANDNRYRKARSCPECRLRVQQYADEVAAVRPEVSARQVRARRAPRPARPSRRAKAR
jgi:hypothetical protein